MGLLSAKQDEEVMAEINITPFTDVLLVLLIIFMILAAIVIPPGFQQDLANHGNPNNNNNQKNQDIHVIVNDKGVIWVDNTKADESSVYNALYDAERKKGKKHVSIEADDKAPYGVIIRILDAAKAADLTDVGFITG